MRLRRFSQLGWLGCQDLAGFVMGEEVERVELGPPPYKTPPPADTEAVPFGQDWVNHRTGTIYVTGSVAIDVNPLVQDRIDEVIARYPENPALKTAQCGMCNKQKPKQHEDSWMPHDVCEDCYWELPG